MIILDNILGHYYASGTMIGALHVLSKFILIASYWSGLLPT